jgi:hypothetical protein
LDGIITRMRLRRLALPLVLAALLPATLAGQARYSVGFGVMAGTKLATDRIFQDIQVTQQLMPTVTIGASLPVSSRERGGLELGLGFGQTRIKESGFPTTDGTSFRLLSISAGVDGPMLGPLRYRVGAGLLKYLADRDGIFRQGGPLLLLLTLGADCQIYTRGAMGLAARLRYDYQRFSTDELRTAGFARTQDVQRVGRGLAIEYTR